MTRAKGKCITFVAVGLTVYTLGFVYVYAASPPVSELVLTVAPPHFSLTVGPGETWSSMLLVGNRNPYDIPVYVSPIELVPDGRVGARTIRPLLIPLRDDTPSLANWIQVSRRQIRVARGATTTVPFTVTVPKNAPPGTYRAALIVGQDPLGGETNPSFVHVSSFVSSVFSLRIAGEVREKGEITEFSISDRFLARPEALFRLTFRNAGNVFVRPRGGITMYDLFGRERGHILLDKDDRERPLGPKEERTWDNRWEEVGSGFSIGPYRAVAHVGFGGDSSVFRTQSVVFYVLPLRRLALLLGVLFLLFLFPFLLVRRYVRNS